MKYPWMPLFWGDFLANTMHLTAQEAGAYLFLIAHAWEHDGIIPSSTARLARIAHVRHDRWQPVWHVLQNFFEPQQEFGQAVGPLISGYRHKRVHWELQRLGKISNDRKAAALQMHAQKDASASASTSKTNRESSSVDSKRDAPAFAATTKSRPYKSDNDLNDPNREDVKTIQRRNRNGG